MIVNLRGTGGSGKSTLVRDLMELYPRRAALKQDGRKQPIGYVCFGAEWNNNRGLYVVGHYETPCGGADTITQQAAIFDKVIEEANHPRDVIFEGIISQDDVRRTSEINKAFPGQLKVIALRVPIEVCLASIQARRDARGDERPLNPKNTVNRQKSLERTISRLRDAGIDAQWMDREAAAIAIREALGVA